MDSFFKAENNLSIETLIKLKEELRLLGPMPVFYECRGLPDDTILHGDAIDLATAKNNSCFHLGIHKAYWIPTYHVAQIEKYGVEVKRWRKEN